MARNIVYLDFEFIEDGKQWLLEPLSLGMVKLTGEELYLQFGDAPFDRANDWVQEHVYPNLKEFKWDSNTLRWHPDRKTRSLWVNKTEARERILDFIGIDTPTFVGYYCDYDWVLFCMLMGNMMNLPDGWPMYCFDIKQFADNLEQRHELPRLEQPSENHNALEDAKWNKVLFEYYSTIEHFLDRGHTDPPSIPTLFAAYSDGFVDRGEGANAGPQQD